MNLQFKKRSRVQRMGTPTLGCVSMAMADQIGFGQDGCAATYVEIKSFNLPGLRKNNKVLQWIFRMVALIAVLLNGSINSYAEIHSDKWNIYDGKWSNDTITQPFFFSIEIENGEKDEVEMDFLFQLHEYAKHYPVYSPLSSEGGECTDILWGGPRLLTHRYFDEVEPYSQVYNKSKSWSYIIQQIRSNANGVILFEVEIDNFPLTDDYSIKAKAEHELGLMTATAEYCIRRFAYAAILKSQDQMELICLGQPSYYYGTDQNGNYGFVGAIFDSNTIFHNQTNIRLNR